MIFRTSGYRPLMIGRQSSQRVLPREGYRPGDAFPRRGLFMSGMDDPAGGRVIPFAQRLQAGVEPAALDHKVMTPTEYLIQQLATHVHQDLDLLDDRAPNGIRMVQHSAVVTINLSTGEITSRKFSEDLERNEFLLTVNYDPDSKEFWIPDSVLNETLGRSLSIANHRLAMTNERFIIYNLKDEVLARMDGHQNYWTVHRWCDRLREVGRQVLPEMSLQDFVSSQEGIEGLKSRLNQIMFREGLLTTHLGFYERLTGSSSLMPYEVRFTKGGQIGSVSLTRVLIPGRYVSHHERGASRDGAVANILFVQVDNRHGLRYVILDVLDDSALNDHQKQVLTSLYHDPEMVALREKYLEKNPHYKIWSNPQHPISILMQDILQPVGRWAQNRYLSWGRPKRDFGFPVADHETHQMILFRDEAGHLRLSQSGDDFSLAQTLGVIECRWGYPKSPDRKFYQFSATTENLTVTNQEREAIQFVLDYLENEAVIR